jgi:glucose/mannose-6-phosphate isomerase
VKTSKIDKNNVYFQLLIEGTTEQKYQAIESLISDKRNRDTILNNLAKMIEQESEKIYSPIPNGIKPGEQEKYQWLNRAMLSEQMLIQTTLGILGPDGLLDDKRFVSLIDRSGMLERLGYWQEHIVTMLHRSKEIAEQFKQKYRRNSIKKVKIFGVGGSGAPHDIAVEIINNFRKTSTEIQVIHADTPNPDYIDEYTLVMLCSFSGNTEETINCYYSVREKAEYIVILSKGGKLEEIAQNDNILFLKFPDKESHPAFVIQPRESVCMQTIATLTLLSCIGLKPGSAGEFLIDDLAFEKDIFPLLKKWRELFGPEVPFIKNPAKQLAFFLLYGIDYCNKGYKTEKYDLWDKKIPFILVDYNNKSIGHEVRTQFHERSKINAAYYEAPEFLHNLVESIRASLESSHANLDKDRFVYYFIRSLDEEERIRLRLNKTIELIIQGKGKYAVLNSEGKNPYERSLFATYFNAHMTTYLALLNGFDPLPVPTMSWIKNVMDEFPRSGKKEKEAQMVQVPILNIFNR